LLYKNKGLVKGIKFKDHLYVGDPINAIRIFNDKEVDELILLDIDATKTSCAPDFSMITEVASECFMPLAYGGGIKSLSDVKRILSLGVEKVVINTAAVTESGLIEAIASNFGSQSVVVSVDVKRNLWGKREVYIESGKKNTHLDPIVFSKKMQDAGAGELMINSIERDGMMNGYDVQLIQDVAKAVTIPIIACGGAGSVNHFAEVLTEGAASAVAAGSFFVFQGPHRAVLISYPENHAIIELIRAC
jgi:cyclase